AVRRTTDAQPPAVQEVRVDHRRADIRVPEELLHRSNVGARLEQMRRERMAERVAGYSLRQPSPRRRPTNGTLHDCLVDVMSAPYTSSVNERARRWKDVRPSPFPFGVGVLPRQRRRNARRQDMGPLVAPEQSLILAETRCDGREAGFGEWSP